MLYLISHILCMFYILAQAEDSSVSCLSVCVPLEPSMPLGCESWVHLLSFPAFSIFKKEK